MISKLISKIKKDDNYSIDSEYTYSEWFIILFERIVQLIRGFIAKIFFVKANGLFFKGKNVSIKHRSSFKAGKNVIIDNNSLINALSVEGIRLGDNVTIAKNCTLICTGVIANKGIGIRIGNNTGINTYCFFGGQGGITIGNNVIVGPYVKVFSENHVFSDIDRTIKEQGETRSGVIINDDCWIGSGSIILDGVELGTKTIVAAGSVVTKSFEGYCVVGGVPAKIIKKLR